MNRLKLFIELAWTVAFGRGPGQRWRRIAIVGTSFIASIALLLGGGIAAMFTSEHNRAVTGLGTLSTRFEPTDVLMLGGADSWDGYSIDVAWMEPVDPSTTSTLLPRGMSALPAPGEAVVSPALARLINENPELAARYRVAGVLEWSGVTTGGDLFAYARPSSPMLSGLPHTLRIASFDGLAGLEQSRSFGMHSSDLSPVYLALGELGLVVIPAFLLLMAGLAAKSPRRDSRFELLRALGLSPLGVRGLSALECALTVMPGAALALFVWGLAAPWLQTIPFTDRRVVPGDLAWPVWAYPLLLTAVTLAAAAVGYLRPQRHPSAAPRPILRRGRVTPWVLLPIGLAGCVFAAMLAVNSSTDADLALLGSVLAIGGAVALVPALIAITGSALGSAHDVSRFLAGRTLAWQPGWLVASFAGLAAMVVTTLGVVGYAASIDYSATWARPRAGAGPSISMIQTPLPPSSSQRDQLVSQLPAALVLGFEITEDEGQGSLVRLTTSCADLRRQLPTLKCGTPTSAGVSAADARVITHWLDSQGLAGPDTKVQLQTHGRPTALAAVSNTPADKLDRQVRAAAASVVPITMIRTAGTDQAENGISWWLTAGLLIADAILLASCLVAVSDQLLAAGSRHRNLHLIGASDQQLHRLFSFLFAAPYLVIAGTSLVVGLFVCQVLRYRAPMPIASIGWMIAGIVLLGVIGTISSRRIGTVRVLSSRD